MGMSKCYSLLKCLVIFFDIIFLCVGVVSMVLAGIGAWYGVGGGPGTAGLGAVGLWGAGAAGGATAGLAGATRGAPSLLAGSFSLLALCAVGEAAAVWWGAAHITHLTQALHDRLHHLIRDDYGNTDTATQIIDTIQLGLGCCGVDSPRDWSRSSWSLHHAHTDTDTDVDLPTDVHAHTDTLDLTLSAPTQYYYIPESCCQGDVVCATRVPVTGSPPIGGCREGVEGWLGGWGRGAAGAGGAVLVAHGADLLATLALALTDHTHTHYKA